MALTKDRKTDQLGTPDITEPQLLSFPVEASAKLFGGAMVATNSSGNAVRASADTTLKVWGICDKQADNSSGNAGDISVQVRQGVFWLANDTGTALTASNVGQFCYVVDDQTVSGSDGAGLRPVAGLVISVDSSRGVAVFLGHINAYATTNVGLTNTTFRVRAVGPTTNVTLSSLTVAGNDGVTLVANDKVLLYAQTSGFQNGPYVVGAVSGGTAPLTRPDWFATGAVLKSGMEVEVGAEGTSYAGTTWKSLKSSDTFTVDTDDPTFYPDHVMQRVTLVAGTSSVTVPVYSSSRSTVVIDYVSGGSTATTSYQTSGALTAGIAGTVVLKACSTSVAVTSTTDTALLTIGVTNW